MSKVISQSKLSCSPTIIELWTDDQTEYIIGFKTIDGLEKNIDTNIHTKKISDFMVEGCLPFCTWVDSLG